MIRRSLGFARGTSNEIEVRFSSLFIFIVELVIFYSWAIAHSLPIAKGVVRHRGAVSL